MELAYTDYRRDPGAWAQKLDIPKEAVDLYLDSEVVDLHTCSFMWTRIFPGYDIRKRHKPWLPRSFAFNQVDLPRCREAQMAAISWDVTTNPYRRQARRPETTLTNIETVLRTLREFPSEFRVTRNYADYQAARRDGCTASLISLQGGNALDDSLDWLDRIPEDCVHRITLVHLTGSRIGTPNSPPHNADDGLTDFGRDFVRKMQSNRILVDLAHINRKGFFDALDATDPTIPIAVTHTGINAVRRIWRNIDDEQIRAIAGRHGTIGIIYHPGFLDHTMTTCTPDRIVDHMQHICDLVGEDHVSLGSDYDGMIALPRGFTDITHQPKLVAIMLARGWSDTRIKKILGGNFLRVFRAIRPN